MLRKIFIASAMLLGSLLATTAEAKTQKYLVMLDEQGQNCWVKSGLKYNIDPWLLMAVAKTESSFNQYAVSPKNRNGTRDYSLMQINTVHLPTLAKHGINLKHLFNPCTAVDVGAWVLAQAFQDLGYTWSAVGAYNTGLGGYRNGKPGKTATAYAQRVYLNYQKLKRLYGQPQNLPTPNPANVQLAQND